MRARRGSGGMLALAFGLALAAPVQPAPEPDRGLAATRALVARLSATGRGEATVRAIISDPLGGPDRVDRGRLSLEPPDRLRLDFPESGERIAVRGEGGEWVQPRVRQMLRLSREQAGTAAWLWEVFLHGEGGAFVERAVGRGRFALAARDRAGGLPESLTVRLDPRGLPAAVEYQEPGGARVRYEFSGWRFLAARGRGAFVLSAPRGYAVVDLP